MSRKNIERQIKKIREIQKSNLNYLDINYQVVDKHGVSLEYGQAILNKYKLWLRSSSTDYIRKPNHAGFFDNALNRYPFNEDSIETIKADLIQKTSEAFPDIELLSVTIKLDYPNKKWLVFLSVRDKITGLVGQTDNNSPIDITDF